MRKGSLTSVKVFYPKNKNKDELLKLISSKLEELKGELPLVRVLLFGSYAKGNYTAGSDIDLLIVYKVEPRDDAYALVKKTLAVPQLELHLLLRRNTRA